MTKDINSWIGKVISIIYFTDKENEAKKAKLYTEEWSQGAFIFRFQNYLRKIGVFPIFLLNIWLLGVKYLCLQINIHAPKIINLIGKYRHTSTPF